MRATLCIDDAVGEHRRVLIDADGKPFRLEIERWSERGRRAKLDEVRWGRVRSRLPGNRGWYVDIGLDEDGVIEPTRAAIVIEGALIPVRIRAEAHSDKGPLLSLADISPNAPRPYKPGLHAASSDDPFVRGVEVLATPEGQEAREAVSAALEEATQRVVEIDGGGNIAIETVRGMTVIDIDTANRASDCVALNLAAAGEAARQLSLRSIGGLIAIDFVSMPDRKEQRAVVDAFRAALAARLGRASDVLDLSKFSVCEAAIARRARPIADALAIPAAEREALDALREIESAGWSARARKIHARLSHAAANWLEADHIGWKDALAGRIGARWMFEAADRPPGRPEVWSV